MHQISSFKKHTYTRFLQVLTHLAYKRFVPFPIILNIFFSGCGSSTDELVGIYETTISTTSEQNNSSLSTDTLETNATPIFSEQGRTLRLELYDDQRAVFTTSFLGGQAPIVQKGSWETQDKSRIRVFFVEKNGRFSKDTLTFSRKGIRLNLKRKKLNAEEISLLKMEPLEQEE